MLAKLKTLRFFVQHDDGHWSGMLGAIANGTVDTACIFYQKTESRLPDFDFTLPIYTVLNWLSLHFDICINSDAFPHSGAQPKCGSNG